MAIWYCERSASRGKWRVELYHQDDKPGPRLMGSDLLFRDGTPIEIPEWMWQIKPMCTMQEIHMCLSPDGEFYGMPDEVHRAIVAYRRHGLEGLECS
jgi:hypothetical protein